VLGLAVSDGRAHEGRAVHIDNREADAASCLAPDRAMDLAPHLAVARGVITAHCPTVQRGRSEERDRMEKRDGLRRCLKGSFALVHLALKAVQKAQVSLLTNKGRLSLRRVVKQGRGKGQDGHEGRVHLP
jgi:hypothetical protein